MNKYGIIVPIYNHAHKLNDLLMALTPLDFPIFLVDDGSDSLCKQAIKEILKSYENVTLQALPINRGKGAAVMKGFQLANQHQLTHAIQIDADFQHDVDDIHAFIHRSDCNPRALICGIPQYDDSVPKGRLYSRYLTHVWVWINTLSMDIADSMCGYRVYPLSTTLSLINSTKISERMNFDIDIIVRLKWRNVKIINQPTKVIYHDDVPSNFRLFKDNVGISLTHAQLFFGMLIRLPILLARKFRGK